MEFYAPPADLFEQREREAMTRLSEALTDDEKRRYGALLVYRPGSPAQEILNYLELQKSIDLVVMGTHGRRAISRLLMGSVAEGVVRAAPCPVLTIRASDGSRAIGSHAA